MIFLINRALLWYIEFEITGFYVNAFFPVGSMENFQVPFKEITGFFTPDTLIFRLSEGFLQPVAKRANNNVSRIGKFLMIISLALVQK
jgi:hypothetical protein